MKSMIRIFALALCACTLLLLGGCSQPPEPTVATVPTTVMPTEPPLTAREKYDLARDNLMQAPNWILSYTVEEKRIVGADTYTEKAEGKASFSKLNQPDMVAVVEETLTYGSYTSQYLEIYCEEAAYSQVNESAFKVDMEPKAFVERQIPAALLDSALYKTVTEEVGTDTTIISFSDAKAVERWVGKSGAKIVSASGTARLDSTGVLRETACQIEYTLGETRYSVTAVVQATAAASLDLGATHKQHIKGSVKIESLDAPKMLLQVVGNVYSSGKMYCDAVESIYSEAIPVAYSQRSIITLTEAEGALTARAEYEIHLSDYRGNLTSKTQVDAFENGVFTTAQNGGKPQENRYVTAQQMRSYCEDAILSALAAPKYLKNASLKVTKDSYRLEIVGNTAFVADMMDNITQFLQVDLEEKTTNKKTLSSGAYLVVDRETGLPTAMGLHMERQHTIDSQVYQLTYQLEQTMALSDYE